MRVWVQGLGLGFRVSGLGLCACVFEGRGGAQERMIQDPKP